MKTENCEHEVGWMVNYEDDLIEARCRLCKWKWKFRIPDEPGVNIDEHVKQKVANDAAKEKTA